MKALKRKWSSSPPPRPEEVEDFREEFLREFHPKFTKKRVPGGS